MKIVLKDYKTSEVISQCPIIDKGVFVLEKSHPTWYREYAEALYFINNADAMNGVIADDWTDEGNSINPYMTYEVSK